MPQFFTVRLSDFRPLSLTRRVPLYRRDYAFVSKRAFDVALALFLLGPVAVLTAVIAGWLKLRQGGAVFYVSERMGKGGVPFQLWKFRTMAPGLDAGTATGGDKSGRITGPGRWLRAYRLDELPQLWNILRGDLSFVGPRPPLRKYVERHGDLYRAVLADRPGLTGLATIIYHRAEARIVGAARSSDETDRIYSRRCVPRKARLDLIYLANRSLWLDIYILWRTVRRY